MQSLETHPSEGLPFLRSWIASSCFVLLSMQGCTQSPASVTVQGSSFDSARAWKDLETLVSIGPRQAGTPGAEKTRDYLKKELFAAGLKPVEEAFKQATPCGELAFANVYVDLPPPGLDATTPWILFCTHYDTKRLPGEFVGANDGGSGTAVLLELARDLARAPRGDFGYRLLFL
ncbi:MAG TPA: M28 family peptidase, partial [Planctomycetota bacterium]|nr:M28 family peptidase [Planctomycetota bacterium]